MHLLAPPNKWCPLCANYLPEIPQHWAWVAQNTRGTVRSAGYCRKCDSLRVMAKRYPEKYEKPQYTKAPKVEELGMLRCYVCLTHKWYTTFKGARVDKRPKVLLCRECHAAQSVHYRRQNPEKVHQARQRWWKANPHAPRMYEHIRRARKVKAGWVRPGEVDVPGMLEAQQGICCYCEKELTVEIATVDHIIPLSRGGDHTPENLAICCLSCNSSKSDKTPQEFEAWRKRVQQVGHRRARERYDKGTLQCTGTGETYD